jgi:hypothetical protein
VRLVVDPHAEQVVGVEDAAGQSLGQATALDVLANLQRKRRKPVPPTDAADAIHGAIDGPNLVELAHARYHGLQDHGTPDAATTPCASARATTKKED